MYFHPPSKYRERTKVLLILREVKEHFDHIKGTLPSQPNYQDHYHIRQDMRAILQHEDGFYYP